MRFVGVDLAERYSAAVVLGEAGDVLSEHYIDAGAQETPPNPFKNIRKVGEWFNTIPTDSATFWAVEIPFFHARNAGPALIVLGGFLRELVVSGYEADLFVSNEWQRYFGYSKKEHADPKKWARALSAEMGYEPGFTIDSKVLARHKKDLIDAYLIAKFFKERLDACRVST